MPFSVTHHFYVAVLIFCCLVMTTTSFSPIVGFSPASSSAQQQRQAAAATISSSSSSSLLHMGLFDFVQDAFKNEDFDDRRCTASHILMDSEDEAMVVLKSISDGSTTFTNAAKEYSTCPSAADGGSLGTFAPGSMVKEFEDLVFGDPQGSPVGQVVGPIQTKFGYHLVLVENRFENQDKSDGSGFF